MKLLDSIAEFYLDHHQRFHWRQAYFYPRPLEIVVLRSSNPIGLWAKTHYFFMNNKRENFSKLSPATLKNMLGHEGGGEFELILSSSSIEVYKMQGEHEPEYVVPLQIFPKVG